MNFASIKKQHKCNQPSVSCLKPNKADRILLNMRLVYNTVFMVNIAEGLLGEPFPSHESIYLNTFSFVIAIWFSAIKCCKYEALN